MPVANLAILVKMSGGLLPPNSRAGDVEIYDSGRMLIFESDTDIVERQIERQKVLDILQYARESGFFQLPNIIHDSGASPNVPDVTLSIVDSMGNNTVTMTSYQRLKGEMRKAPFDLVYKRITDLAWESYTNGAQPAEQQAAVAPPAPAMAKAQSPAPPAAQSQIPPLPFSNQNIGSSQPPGFDLPSLDDLLKSSGLQFDAPSSPSGSGGLPPINAPQQNVNNQKMPTLPPLNIPAGAQQRPQPPSQPKPAPKPPGPAPQMVSNPPQVTPPVPQPTPQRPPQIAVPIVPSQKKEPPVQIEQRPQTYAPVNQQTGSQRTQQNIQPQQSDQNKPVNASRENEMPRQKQPEQKQSQPTRAQQENSSPRDESARGQSRENTQAERPAPPRTENAEPRINRQSEKDGKQDVDREDNRRQQMPNRNSKQGELPSQRKPPIAWERTQEAVEKLEESLHSKVLIFYAANAKLEMEDMRYLYSHLRKLGRKKSLYVIPFIQETDSTVVWRMATLIREFCEELNVILPEESTMATTMFSLAADSILMNPFGFLSPIDTNFTHALLEKSLNNEMAAVSISEIFQAATIPTAKAASKQKEEGINSQADTTPNTFHPLITAAAARQFALTQRICTNLLKLSVKNKRSESEISKIVTQLTQGYPSPHYPIVYFEAQSLGLPVSETAEAVNDILWDLIKEYVYITQPVLHYQNDNKLFAKQNIIIESTGRRTIHYSEQLSTGSQNRLVEEHTRWRELTEEISVNSSAKESRQLLWKELQLVGSNEN